MTKIYREQENFSKNDLHKIIPKFYSFRQQLHIYHLQTLSYSRHKASDELLEKLTEFIDSFIEIYSGKYGRIKFAGPTSITIDNLNDDNAVTFLDSMINYYLHKLPTYLDQKNDTDLLNLRDEILATTNKTKYLFTLN